MFRVFILIAILVHAHTAHAQLSYTPPALAVPGKNSTYPSLFSSYCSKDNTTFLSWKDDYEDVNNPYYAVYDWSTYTFKVPPTRISSSVYVWNNVTNCFIEKENKVFLTWADNTTNHNPWYAVFDCASGNFSIVPIQIDSSGYLNGITRDIYSCYNSKDNTVILSWADNTNHNPWYTVYDCTSGSFIVNPTQISQGTYTVAVYVRVIPCYIPSKNQVILSWADNTINNNPWYAVYDCVTNSFTTPQQINTSIQTIDVYSCYNSYDDKVFLCISNNSDSDYPYYAIYDCQSESISSNFQILSNMKDVFGNIYPSYNRSNNTVLITWKDSNLDPIYAVFDCKTNLLSINPTQIAEGSYTQAAYGHVFSSYNFKDKAFFVGWASIKEEGYFSIFYDQKSSLQFLLASLRKFNPTYYQK